LIPYTKHHIEAEDIIEVLRILQGPAITQGTMINWLEDEFKKFVGSKFAVAVTSGTSALHSALVGANIQSGDEVIVPSMTFVATANAVKYMNATPVFADIDPRTLLIDPDDIERKITGKTKAIIAVDFAGQPADYERLNELKNKYNLILIADACHSLGATYKKENVGTLADFSCFSLHATKLITSGEGGLVTTNDKKAFEKMRAFRNHGRIDGNMKFLGQNYRMTHLQAGLCIHQIKRIPLLIATRQKISSFYDMELRKLGITTLEQKKDRTNARHIYVIFIKDRQAFRNRLATYGVGSQIHYKPVTLQDYYNCAGETPIAEKIWEDILTIPLYPQLSSTEQEVVIRGLKRSQFND
jgi:perosamine synthetase